MKRLDNKNALVTGASRGIGRAIVEAFVNEGANVFACARGEKPDGLNEKCEWIKLDVASASQVQKIAKSIAELDILVNNAGVQVEKTVVDSSDDDWENVMGVNAYGVFNMCRAMIPKMKKGGAIINVGSISGNVADPSMALYNASKAFVHGLTRSIAVDHGPEVRCNAICPGWINTGMLDAGFELADEPQAVRKDAVARHPVGRFGEPEDVANLAVWLASEEASFANGQMFTIDGGMTAGSPINSNLF